MRVLVAVTFIHIFFLYLPLANKSIDQVFTKGESQRIQVSLISKKVGRTQSITQKKHNDVGTHKKESTWKLFHPAPSYPKQALKKGWEGKVVVTIDSDKNGKVSRKEIHKSSGFIPLDRAALQTLSKWKTMANLKSQKVPFVFKIKQKI